MSDKYPGTPLDKGELKRGKIFMTSYVPKLRYCWDTGEAIGRYLEELRNGRLIARSCNGCQRIMIPPRMFCERCFRPTDEWVYVKDNGASHGMGILHLVKKAPLKQVRVGMPVRAVWRTPSQRRGSVTDISYWEPDSLNKEVG